MAALIVPSQAWRARRGGLDPRPALLALALLAGCGREPAAPPTPSPLTAPGGADAADHAASASERVVALQAAGGVVDRLAARVALGPGAAAHVTAPGPGRILAVAVAVGDAVRRGDRLLQLESPALQRVEAALRALRPQLSAVQARLAVVRSLQRDGLADGGQRFALEREALALQAAVADAEAQRAPFAAASIDRAEGGGRLWLLAPADGVVVALRARPHALIEAGDSHLAELRLPAPPRFELRSWTALPVGARLRWRPLAAVAGGNAAAPDGDLWLEPAPLLARVDPQTGQRLTLHAPLATTATATALSAQSDGAPGVVDVVVGDAPHADAAGADGAAHVDDHAAAEPLLAAPATAVRLRLGQRPEHGCVVPADLPATTEPGAACLAVDVIASRGAELLLQPRHPGLRAGVRVFAVAPVEQAQGDEGGHGH